MRLGVRVTFFLNDVDYRRPVYTILLERGPDRALHWHEQAVVDVCRHDALATELRRGLKVFIYQHGRPGDPRYDTL
jgi:hypothetical protein